MYVFLSYLTGVSKERNGQSTAVFHSIFVFCECSMILDGEE